MASTMLLDMPVFLPLPLLTSLAWPLLLSLLSEDFTLELDVMLLTLLEPSMLPRGRLRLMLMLTTLPDTVLDTLDWPLLPSLLSEVLMLELAVMLLTLLEPSMSHKLIGQLYHVFVEIIF